LDGFPNRIIAVVPMLNRVGHVYTDFSYLLVIHLTIQSAYGFKWLARNGDFRRAAVDFLWMALIFEGIILAYCFGTTHRPIPFDYFLCAGAGAIGAPLLFLFLKSHKRPISAIGGRAFLFWDLFLIFVSDFITLAMIIC